MTENIDFEQLMEQQRQLLKEIQSGEEGGPLSASLSSLTSVTSTSSSLDVSRSSTASSSKSKAKAKAKAVNKKTKAKPLSSSRPSPSKHQTKSSSPEPFVAYGWTFERVAPTQGQGQRHHRHRQQMKSKNKSKAKAQPTHRPAQKHGDHPAQEWISDWHFERVHGSSSNSGKPPRPPPSTDADSAAAAAGSSAGRAKDGKEAKEDHKEASFIDQDSNSCHSGATPEWFFQRIPAREHSHVSSSLSSSPLRPDGKPKTVKMINDGNRQDGHDDDEMMLDDDINMGLDLPAAHSHDDIFCLDPDDISLEEFVMDDNDDMMVTEEVVSHNHHHHPSPQTKKTMHASSLTAATAPMDDDEMGTPSSSMHNTPGHDKYQQNNGTNPPPRAPPRLPCAEGMDDMFKSTLQKLTESMKRTAETRQSLMIKTSKTKEYERSLCINQILQSVQSSSAHVGSCLEMYQQHNTPSSSVSPAVEPATSNIQQTTLHQNKHQDHEP